jgi:DNA-binding response OmpR family regulator
VEQTLRLHWETILSLLKVLIVGSSGTSAEALMGEIRLLGLDPRFTLAEDERSLTERLGAENWNLALINDEVTDLSTTRAVAMILAADAGVPIIVVCSRESEDEAITTMRIGGRDDLLRDDLSSSLDVCGEILRLRVGEACHA